MKKIQIEIPDGKRAERVNGVLTLVDENLPKFKFKIGDKVTRDSNLLEVFTIAKQLYLNGELYYSVEGRPDCLPYKESELTLYNCEPKVDYKFKVGDKVKTIAAPALKYTIAGQFAENGEPMYKLSDGFGETSCPETWLAPQSITERIETFSDAVVWCVANGKKEMTDVYAFIHDNLSNREGEIDEEDKDIIAYLKLRIITCALNEGWAPKLDGSEENWHVDYIIEEDFFTCDEYQYFTPNSRSMIFKSEELAIYAAKQFRDIYADFYGVKKGGQE